MTHCITVHLSDPTGRCAPVLIVGGSDEIEVTDDLGSLMHIRLSSDGEDIYLHFTRNDGITDKKSKPVPMWKRVLQWRTT